LEVDDAVLALVAAAAEARADDALVVAAALLLERLQQGLLRLALAVGDVGEVADGRLPAARRHRLVLADTHGTPSIRAAVSKPDARARKDRKPRWRFGL